MLLGQLLFPGDWFKLKLPTLHRRPFVTLHVVRCHRQQTHNHQHLRIERNKRDQINLSISHPSGSNCFTSDCKIPVTVLSKPSPSWYRVPVLKSISRTCIHPLSTDLPLQVFHHCTPVPNILSSHFSKMSSFSWDNLLCNEQG